ncbi:MAG: hypothetical protein MUC81_13815 [Bacteroidia bacterium]|jgi:hypothetical protein|nr:hypothetical protein [Bacteroidia bacterium]
MLGAGKFLQGASTAYNLNKCLNFIPKKVKTGAMEKLWAALAMFKNNKAWLLYIQLEAIKNING